MGRDAAAAAEEENSAVGVEPIDKLTPMPHADNGLLANGPTKVDQKACLTHHQNSMNLCKKAQDCGCYDLCFQVCVVMALQEAAEYYLTASWKT